MDDANIEHLPRHDVSPAEFEHAMLNDPEDLHYDLVEGEDRFHCVGVTNAGRLLFIAWTLRWGKNSRGHRIRCPTFCEKRMEEQTTMKMPTFKTEAEEAQWLYDNPDRFGKEFARAMREGKTTRLAREKLVARIEASKAKAINIRLPEADLRLARDLTAKKGLRYQTYIKSLLHEALQREAQR